MKSRFNLKFTLIALAVVFVVLWLLIASTRKAEESRRQKHEAEEVHKLGQGIGDLLGSYPTNSGSKMRKKAVEMENERKQSEGRP